MSIEDDAKSNDDDIDIDEFSNDDIFEEIVNSRTIVLYLDEEIGKASYYRKLCSKLRSATDKDIIRVVMSSPGGNYYTMTQLHRYFMNCKARIICELNFAYSAGASLTLSCDEIIPDDSSEMMFHSSSISLHGKVSDVLKRAKLDAKLDEEFAKKMYKGFLTGDEINKVIEGEEVWLTAPEIKKKLKTWVPIRNRKIKQ